ncbi:uncharacterized protein [Penaeus vannamei]|uniref:uncharacterized protein n=1 Tax=Penaeus vannamei TaxID=6689 RepID=UPI00387F8A34
MNDSGKGDLNSFTDEYCNKSKSKLKDCPKNSQTAKLENLSRTPSDFLAPGGHSTPLSLSPLHISCRRYPEPREALARHSRSHHRSTLNTTDILSPRSTPLLALTTTHSSYHRYPEPQEGPSTPLALTASTPRHHRYPEPPGILARHSQTLTTTPTPRHHRYLKPRKPSTTLTHPTPLLLQTVPDPGSLARHSRSHHPPISPPPETLAHISLSPPTPTPPHHCPSRPPEALALLTLTTTPLLLPPNVLTPEPNAHLSHHHSTPPATNILGPREPQHHSRSPPPLHSSPPPISLRHQESPSMLSLSPHSTPLHPHQYP